MAEGSDGVTMRIWFPFLLLKAVKKGTEGHAETDFQS